MGEGEIVRVSDSTIQKNDGGFLRLSFVTIALSLTILSQFSIECLRRSYKCGGGSLCGKISGARGDQCKPNLNAI